MSDQQELEPGAKQMEQELAEQSQYTSSPGNCQPARA